MSIYYHGKKYCGIHVFHPSPPEDVVEIATPQISVSSGGLITASVNQIAGKVFAGIKSATLQLASMIGGHITPTGANQTVVEAGTYVTTDLIVDAMPSAEQATPSISVSSGGLITASATQSAGYVSSGTKSATQQLTVQAAKTVTPTESEQVAVAAQRYTTGQVKVGAISSDYVGSGVSRQAGSTVSPSTSEQVAVPAGTYVTGDVKVGAVEGVEQATPSISVNASGLITASATQEAGFVSAGTKSSTQQLATQAAKTVNPTESSQTAVASGVYTTGAITVGAIDSSYVGSGITRRSSTDLTANGDTVSVPAGYYSATASKAVAHATAGTPTATKGAVSNHSVAVTPKVTNPAGYITAGTITGSAVTVNAAELVSGSETKTANGSYDVTNLATLVVAIPVYDGSVS